MNLKLDEAEFCFDDDKVAALEPKLMTAAEFLKLAEGQIRGIQNMVENDAYCPDILIQVSAVTAALNSFNKRLLACHIRSCVSEDIRAGNEEAIDEFVGMLQKLMK